MKQGVRPMIFGVPFDALTLYEAIERTAQAMRGSSLFHVVTPGPEFLVTARDNPNFRNVLRQANLSLADGFGIVLAARCLGIPSISRVPGMEYCEALLHTAAQHGWRVFFFGAQFDIADRAVQKILHRYPNLQIAGIDREYRGWRRISDAYICWRIRRARTDLLLVALGAPKQELWIHNNRDRLQTVKVAIGVGGAFDFWSGSVLRAPVFVRRLGLEWIWRLFQEPRKRWRRIITATWSFTRAVLSEKRRLHA